MKRYYQIKIRNNNKVLKKQELQNPNKLKEWGYMYLFHPIKAFIVTANLCTALLNINWH